MRWIVLSLTLTLAVSSCAGEPQTQQTTPPDTMKAVALASYDPTAYDTITWETDQAALDRGQLVYRHSCARCHGDHGLGDAGFVLRGDTLRPLSLQREDWPYTGDKATLRMQVFVGTDEGMPHWGLEGLRPRDTDAVAIYIARGLRGGF
jgi:mono/diheme cytochrome c family protein